MRYFYFLLALSSCTIITRNIAPAECSNQPPRCDGVDLVLCEGGVEVRIDCGSPQECDATNQICISCGDGTISTGEECDDGPDNSDATPDACRADCTNPSCGDLVVDALEGCDDGNLNNGDGCNAACVSESCGDGVVEAATEQCDDGNLNDNDGCSSVCRIELCGDNITQINEECDDGLNNSDTTPDACRADCTNPSCGDNVVDNNEQCDDGNTTAGDGCSDLCIIEACGDGVINNANAQGNVEECDDGNIVAGDGCSNLCLVEACGDGVTQSGLGEECDDGDLNDNDGCDSDCIPTVTIDLDLGGSHSCALLGAGGARCFGVGANGQLGYGNNGDIGDNETPAAVGDVPAGAGILQISAGDAHTCAVLAGGGVRCWGTAGNGQLGYGNTTNVGDNETPASVGVVNVGGAVQQVAAGGLHTCALLTTGNVRCWGLANFGELGYGNTTPIGDNESPAAAGNVTVGGAVQQVATGLFHSCALLTTGTVRCWGSASSGQLGYGNINQIGDNETPVSAGDVNLGLSATQISLGNIFSCALLTNGSVRCWGNNGSGQLGTGQAANIGDDESPSSIAPISLGAGATQISAGDNHACALLQTGAIVCWGNNSDGQLGYGDTQNIGDDETPATAGPISVDSTLTVQQISAGGNHTCALLDSGKIRCWGNNLNGQLGYGNVADILDATSAADVTLF